MKFENIFSKVCTSSLCCSLKCLLHSIFNEFFFKFQDFQLQTLERKIARLQGEKSSEEKDQLEEKIKVTHILICQFVHDLFLFYSFIFVTSNSSRSLPCFLGPKVTHFHITGHITRWLASLSLR